MTLLKWLSMVAKAGNDPFEMASQCMGEDRNDPSKRPTNIKRNVLCWYLNKYVLFGRINEHTYIL